MSTARIRIAVACAASVAACIGYAAARPSIANEWLRSHGGGIPYTAFWVLLAGIFFPYRRYCIRIGMIVAFAVCGLELLQLWRFEPLDQFRQTPFGAALLGSTFNWRDIPPYFIGGAIGAAILWPLGEPDVDRKPRLVN